MESSCSQWLAALIPYVQTVWSSTTTISDTVASQICTSIFYRGPLYIRGLQYIGHIGSLLFVHVVGWYTVVLRPSQAIGFWRPGLRDRRSRVELVPSRANRFKANCPRRLSMWPDCGLIKGTWLHADKLWQTTEWRGITLLLGLDPHSSLSTRRLYPWYSTKVFPMDT